MDKKIAEQLKTMLEITRKEKKKILERSKNGGVFGEIERTAN